MSKWLWLKPNGTTQRFPQEPFPESGNKPGLQSFITLPLASSSRRHFLSGLVAGGLGTLLGCRGFQAAKNGKPQMERTFHLSIAIEAFEADPELIPMLSRAGVGHIWLAPFFAGYWHYSIEKVNAWRARLESAGFHVHLITIPLGHPSFTRAAPDYMPKMDMSRKTPALTVDGRVFYGVSIHPPVCQENVAAMAMLKQTRPGTVFLDDDFRLALGPGTIGGCFCNEHKSAFLRQYGYGQPQWQELRDAVLARRLTPTVAQWVDHTCDALTDCFRAQQAAAAPEMQLGIMVMYLGAEKAGIRLSDYSGLPVRVGELMFDDASFAPVKGKTDELFSVLFHRRYAPPTLAYSETTAWPAEKLSADNMAAKLVTSTIADVRNTMFMSGIRPFPRTHWDTLAPAMREQARIHRAVMGHKLQGPLKHFWGRHSRYVGDDNPYSLFLAMGLPFEVLDSPSIDCEGGWVFLADADARGVAAGEIKIKSHAQIVYRPDARVRLDRGHAVAESPADLARLKQTILKQTSSYPYVEEDAPVVCAWYPTAHHVLLWNLAEEPRTVILNLTKIGHDRRSVTIRSLGTALIDYGDF